MRTVFVIPSTGVKVRDPVTGQRIPSTGSLVTFTTFIRRRLRDGSLKLADPPEAASASRGDPQRSEPSPQEG